MNGLQTLTAILTIAAIVCGCLSFKAWLAYRSQEKALAAEVRARERAQERESELLRIIRDLARQNAQLATKTASEEK